MMPDRGRNEYEDDDGWAFGDVWKKGSPDDAIPEDVAGFVEVYRTDTGRGFDDSLALDLVSFLGSRGIRATYDSVSLGMEPAAIKTYVIKVEVGRERDALELIREKLKA